MATQQIETLRARVQALGCQLFEDSGEDDGKYYVLDPKVGKLVCVCVDETDLETWIVDRETDRQDATKDDFNSPTVRASYERFLSLVVCANPRDRFKAMDIRCSEGVEAAIKFIGQCSVTDEQYGDEPPAKVFVFDEALLGLERIRHLGRAIQNEVDDGDAHTPLFVTLEREVEAVEKIVAAKQRGGKGGAA